MDGGVKKMKGELPEEKEKKIQPSVLSTRDKLILGRTLISKIDQTRLTMDMKIAGTAINTITAIMLNSTKKKFPQNNQFSPHETDARQYYERENQNFQRPHPPNRTLTNLRHQVVIFVINNPARFTLPTVKRIKTNKQNTMTKITTPMLSISSL